MPNLDVCGIIYPYPNVGDRPWGLEHIDWATAVSNCVTANEGAIQTLTTQVTTNTNNITTLNADLSNQVETSSNSGTGEGIALPKVGTDLPFKSIVAGANITLTPSADELEIAAAGGGGGEVNTASNVGAGEDIFKQKVGVDLEFKTIVAGANITLTPSADEVEISTTALVPSAYQISINSNGVVTTGTFTTLPGNPSATVNVLANQGVLVMLVPDGTYDASAYSGIQPQDTAAGPNPHVRFRLMRGGTQASRFVIVRADDLSLPGGGTASLYLPPSCVTFFDDNPGAGTYVYTIQYAQFGSQTALGNMRILAIVLSEQ